MIFCMTLWKKTLWPRILNPTNVSFLFNRWKLVPTKVKPSTVSVTDAECMSLSLSWHSVQYRQQNFTKHFKFPHICHIERRNLFHLSQRSRSSSGHLNGSSLLCGALVIVYGVWGRDFCRLRGALCRLMLLVWRIVIFYFVVLILIWNKFLFLNNAMALLSYVSKWKEIPVNTMLHLAIHKTNCSKLSAVQTYTWCIIKVKLAIVGYQLAYVNLFVKSMYLQSSKRYSQTCLSDHLYIKTSCIKWPWFLYPNVMIFM